MEATRASVTSGNENYYNMEPTYQTGYTQQEVEGKEILKSYEEVLLFSSSMNGKRKNLAIKLQLVHKLLNLNLETTHS